MQKKLMALGVLAVAVLAVTVAPMAVAAFIDPQFVMHAAVAAGAGLMFVGDIQFVTSKELREQRAKLAADNAILLAKIGAEKDQARVKELEAEWDKRDADILELDRKIARAERQETLDEQGRKPVHDRRSGRDLDRPAPESELSPEEDKIEQQRAFRYLIMGQIHGMQNLTEEARALVNKRCKFQKLAADEVRAMEKRDGLSTTNASGGYTIPALFFNELQNSLKAFGGAREFARVITTENGQSLPIPTVDDTGNVAAIVSEGSALTSPVDTSFGQVTVATFMYRSLLPMTFELAQDSAFDMEAWIREALTVRLGRGTNRHFTTGNGTTQPKGFIPGSSSGKTATSATVVSFDDLVDLQHSVDPAYRRGPSVGWMFNDTTLKIIKKMKDSQNRPLWIPGVALREPDTILGYKYAVNQDMADYAASNKPIAFGDWSKFLIRDVRNPMIIRANEKFLDQGMFGFYLFSRHGSNVLDAGTDPIKHMTCPSPD